MTFYKRYPADYYLDTNLLTMTEDGAYTRMLDYIYRTGKPLPKDRERLYIAIRARSEEEKKAIDLILSEFWEEEDEGWVHPRAKKEIAAAKKQAETNKKIAREREEKRKQKRTNRETIHNRAATRNQHSVSTQKLKTRSSESRN